jgi:hypothetical protein
LNAAFGAISPRLGTAPSEYRNRDRGDYRSGYVAVSAAILIEGTRVTAASLLTGGGAAAALLLAPESGGGSLVAAGSAVGVGVVAGILSKNAGENLTYALKSENSTVQESGTQPEGAKSVQQYNKHNEKLQQAKGQLSQLEEELQQTKGPKKQTPIKAQIENLKQDIKGHEKEMRQKWPDGPPTE